MLEVFTRFSSWLKSCMIAKSLSISILNGLEETDITVLEVTPMVTSSNNKRHWRWWRCKKLTKQNAIKKTDEIKTAVMIRGVKAPDRSQVTKLDYALWCRQEQVIRNVSNVTEMSEMSPLCEKIVQWKWKRENSHDRNRQYIQVFWRWVGEKKVNCLSTNQGLVIQGRCILNGDTSIEVMRTKLP